MDDGCTKARISTITKREEDGLDPKLEIFTSLQNGLHQVRNRLLRYDEIDTRAGISCNINKIKTMGNEGKDLKGAKGWGMEGGDFVIVILCYVPTVLRFSAAFVRQ